jgi:NAD(P)-dependent dehydrogenase (short-subunit alcohol dehydrogenase family)
VARTVDLWGRLDVMVANAAVVAGTISDGDPARWRDVIDTNVNGT